MGTQQFEGIVVHLHMSEHSRASACWQNTLFPLAAVGRELFEKWSGTMGCDADGRKEAGHLKGVSQSLEQMSHNRKLNYPSPRYSAGGAATWFGLHTHLQFNCSKWETSAVSKDPLIQLPWRWRSCFDFGKASSPENKET